MYPYHNRIRQRIKNGELTNFYFTASYPNIGKALVLVFSTEPFLRPIRPHRWGEYIDLLVTNHIGDVTEMVGRADDGA